VNESGVKGLFSCVSSTPPPPGEENLLHPVCARGRIQSEEIIVVKYLRSNKPGFLGEIFPIHEYFAKEEFCVCYSGSTNQEQD
jgi:hypothetical protein